MEKLKFNTKKIAVIGIMGGLSFILYLLNLPVPALFPSFLEINVSDVPALICSFAFGPVGIVVVAIKVIIKLPLSSTCGVGELADFLNGVALVLPAGLYYKKHKNKKGALISIILGGACSVLIAVLFNYLFLVKAYVHFFANGDFNIIIGACKSLYKGINQNNFYVYYIFLAVIPFNVIRIIIVGLITFAIYKRVSGFLNKYDIKG